MGKTGPTGSHFTMRKKNKESLHAIFSLHMTLCWCSVNILAQVRSTCEDLLTEQAMRKCLRFSHII